MINYSIVMRSVNGNLFEINQAKSRVGKFARYISSHGCVYSRADRFSAQNITGVNVVWECGQEFRNLINDAEFNLVASRSGQAAVHKAIKEGNNVDYGPAEY